MTKYLLCFSPPEGSFLYQFKGVSSLKDSNKLNEWLLKTARYYITIDNDVMDRQKLVHSHILTLVTMYSPCFYIL